MATSANDNNSAAAGDFDKVEETGDKSTTVTFETQVNDAASTMVEDNEGLWQLPEDHGLSKEVAFAAGLEKRRRDTQSSAAKTSQELTATKDRADKLESKLKEAFKPIISAEEQDRLDDLKSTDPEAYRTEMNKLEAEATDAFEEELSGMGYDADEITEMADRTTQLTDFLEDNPGLTLNDEVFENDLPPRLVKQLEEGEISFKDFLSEAKKVLTQITKIADTDDDDEEPNLGKAGGGSNAADTAVDKDIKESYKKTIF